MEKSRKHILWISPGFAENEADDSCIPTLQDLSRYISQKGDFKLTVVSLYYPFEKSEYFFHNVRVIALGGQNPRRLKKIAFLQRAKAALSKLILNEKVDLIHSFWFQDSTLLGQSLSKKFRIPLVATFMGQDLIASKYHRLIRWDRIQIICLCENSRERFQQINSKTCEVIPFGLPEIEVSKIVERKVDLISVGSVIPLKNHGAFIDLVAGLKKAGHPVVAKIIGEWHDPLELNRLQKKIEEYQLGDSLEILNKLSRQEVYTWYKITKIVVHSSLFEGQGMVMQEGLQHGCRVVSMGAGIQLNSKHFHLSTESTVLALVIDLLHRPPVEKGENILPVSTTYASHKSLYFSLTN